MSMKLINIRMDEDLKKEMEIVCNDLGINITTAFTIFAKKLTREKRIPFSVSIDSFYSNKNIAALQNSIDEVKDGKVIMKTIEELEGFSQQLGIQNFELDEKLTEFLPSLAEFLKTKREILSAEKTEL